MHMTTQDCLKKAILDTQEKIRDFMNYADTVEDEPVSKYFRQCAEQEGHQAHEMQVLLNSRCQ